MVKRQTVIPFCIKNHEDLMILSDAIEDVKMFDIAYRASRVESVMKGNIIEGIQIHIECLNGRIFDVVLK